MLHSSCHKPSRTLIYDSQILIEANRTFPFGMKMTGFLSVEKLIDFLKFKGKRRLVTIDFKDTIREAVETMIRNDFSQLPVRKKEKVEGIITFDLIARTLFYTRENHSRKAIDILKCKVGDSTKKVPIRSYHEDIFDLMNTVAKDSFLLVKTKGEEIEIITNYDIITYFRELTEPFLIINDIENQLKERIRPHFMKLSAQEKAEILKFKKNWKNPHPPRTIERLGFSHYIAFISSYWSQFQDSLGNKAFFLRCLDKTRNVRNDVCHCRGVIDKMDMELLRFTLNYLELREDE